MNPIERLALSRERLRVVLMPPPTKFSGHLFGERFAAMATDFFERIKAMPGVAQLIAPVEAWWAEHPLRNGGLVVADACRKLTASLAERHPLGLMFGGLLVGAILVLSRPWRWIAMPALLAGLLPGQGSRTGRESPIASLAKLFASLTASRAGAAKPINQLASTPPT